MTIQKLKQKIRWIVSEQCPQKEEQLQILRSLIYDIQAYDEVSERIPLDYYKHLQPKIIRLKMSEDINRHSSEFEVNQPQKISKVDVADSLSQCIKAIDSLTTLLSEAFTHLTLLKYGKNQILQAECLVEKYLQEDFRQFKNHYERSNKLTARLKLLSEYTQYLISKLPSYRELFIKRTDEKIAPDISKIYTQFKRLL